MISDLAPVERRLRSPWSFHIIEMSIKSIEAALAVLEKPTEVTRHAEAFRVMTALVKSEAEEHLASLLRHQDRFVKIFMETVKTEDNEETLCVYSLSCFSFFVCEYYLVLALILPSSVFSLFSVLSFVFIQNISASYRPRVVVGVRSSFCPISRFPPFPISSSPSSSFFHRSDFF